MKFYRDIGMYIVYSIYLQEQVLKNKKLEQFNRKFI